MIARSARACELAPAAFVLAAGVGLHLLFLVSLRTGWLNPLFNDSMHRFGPGCDFFSIYAAGVKARLGESVYTIGDRVDAAPYAYAFRYAPVVAYTLGLALSLLPNLAAYAAWLIGCELALLRNIRLTAELAPDRATAFYLAALWLCYTPYYLELYVGQFTFVTAGLVFWAVLGWNRSARPGRPSVALSLGWADRFWSAAVWLKMMPLLYAPIALLRGRRRTVVWCCAALAATSLAYFATFPGDWRVFAATNMDPRPTWHAGNQGLMALLWALSGERLRTYLAWRTAAIAVVGALLLAFWRRAWLADRNAPSAHPESGARIAVLYTLCTCAYLLLYKDVWEHHYVLLLPAFALLALNRVPARNWLPAYAVAALPCLFALYDVPAIGYNEDPQRYWGPVISLLHHGWKPLAPLWLTVALALREWAPLRFRLAPAHRPAVHAAVAALIVVSAACATRWAGAAITEQRRIGARLVMPPSVFQRQSRPQDCGPAALAAVCRHFGIAATEEEIAVLAGTTERGTSMWGLEQAARRKGLATECRRLGLDQLARAPMPCILYFHAGHFAVLMGMQGGTCFLADPTLGQVAMPRAWLQTHWSGEMMAVGPGDRAAADAPDRQVPNRRILQ